MTEAHIIEIDGLFVAAAVRQSGGCRIVAIDPRLEDLDGSVWPTLEEAIRQARGRASAGLPEPG